ncbi:hypothetical protein CERSUDRAFT_83490, partial [Gelatoporia subvermispora B]
MKADRASDGFISWRSNKMCVRKGKNSIGPERDVGSGRAARQMHTTEHERATILLSSVSKGRVTCMDRA